MEQNKQSDMNKLVTNEISGEKGNDVTSKRRCREKIKMTSVFKERKLL